MNWMEKTMQDLQGMLAEPIASDSLDIEEHDNLLKYVRAKLLESYKNGAYAERRKAFTRSPKPGSMKVYGKKEEADHA